MSQKLPFTVLIIDELELVSKQVWATDEDDAEVVGYREYILEHYPHEDIECEDEDEYFDSCVNALGWYVCAHGVMKGHRKITLF